METIFRVSDMDQKKSYLNKWFTCENTRNAFMNIKNEEFETDCRSFLNVFNLSNPLEQKVFSYAVKHISLGRYQLQKPRDSKVTEFWVDFNINSSTISAFVNDDNSEESNSQWEMISIKKETVKDFRVNVTAENLVLILRLYEPASDLSPFCPFAPEQYVKIVSDKCSKITDGIKKIFGQVKYVELPAVPVLDSPASSCGSKKFNGKTSVAVQPLTLLSSQEKTVSTTGSAEKIKKKIIPVQKNSLNSTIDNKQQIEPVLNDAVVPSMIPPCHKKIKTFDIPADNLQIDVEQIIPFEVDSEEISQSEEFIENSQIQDEKSKVLAEDSEKQNSEKNDNELVIPESELLQEPSNDVLVEDSQQIESAQNKSVAESKDVELSDASKLVKDYVANVVQHKSKNAEKGKTPDSKQKVEDNKTRKSSKAKFNEHVYTIRALNESKNQTVRDELDPDIIEEQKLLETLKGKQSMQFAREKPESKKLSMKGKVKKLLSVHTSVFQDSPDETYQPPPIKDPFERQQRKTSKMDSVKGKLKGSKNVPMQKEKDMYEFEDEDKDFSKKETKKTATKGRKKQTNKGSKGIIETIEEDQEYERKQAVNAGTRRTTRRTTKVVNYKEPEEEQEEEKKKSKDDSDVDSSDMEKDEKNKPKPSPKAKLNKSVSFVSPVGETSYYEVEPEYSGSDAKECSQSVDLDERPSHEEIADNKKPTHIETMDVDEGIRIDFAVEKADERALTKYTEDEIQEVVELSGAVVKASPTKKRKNQKKISKKEPDALFGGNGFKKILKPFEKNVHCGWGKKIQLPASAFNTFEFDGSDDNHSIDSGKKKLTVAEIFSETPWSKQKMKKERITKEYKVRKGTKEKYKSVYEEVKTNSIVELANSQDSNCHESRKETHSQVKLLSFNKINSSDESDACAEKNKRRHELPYSIDRHFDQDDERNSSLKKTKKSGLFYGYKSKEMKKQIFTKSNISHKKSDENEKAKKKKYVKRKQLCEMVGLSSQLTSSQESDEINKNSAKQQRRKKKSPNKKKIIEADRNEQLESDSSQFCPYENKNNNNLIEKNSTSNIRVEEDEKMDLSQDMILSQECHDQESTQCTVGDPSEIESTQPDNQDVVKAESTRVVKTEKTSKGVKMTKEQTTTRRTKATRQRSDDNEGSDTHMEVVQTLSQSMTLERSRKIVDDEIMSSCKSGITSVEASQEPQKSFIDTETPSASKLELSAKKNGRKSLEQVFENIEALSKKQFRRKLWKSPVVVINDILDSPEKPTYTPSSRRLSKSPGVPQSSSTGRKKKDCDENKSLQPTNVSQGSSRELVLKSNDREPKLNFSNFCKDMMQVALSNKQNDEIESSMEITPQVEVLPIRDVIKMTSTSDTKMIEYIEDDERIPDSLSMDELEAKSQELDAIYKDVDLEQPSYKSSALTSYNSRKSKNELNDMQPMLQSFQSNVSELFDKRKEAFEKFVNKVSKTVSTKMHSTLNDQQEKRRSIDSSFVEDCSSELDRWYLSCEEKEGTLMKILDSLKDSLKEGTHEEKSSIKRLKKIHDRHLEEKEKLYTQEKEQLIIAENEIRVEIKKLRNAMMQESKYSEIVTIRNALKNMVDSV